MSQKIVDPLGYLKLYKSDVGRSLAERSLLDKRLTEEADKQALEDRARFDKPAVPEAQLVYNPATHAMGVAVRGAKRVCQLPKGYGGPGCELAMWKENAFVVIQPDKPTLLINPETGTTREL